MTSTQQQDPRAASVSGDRWPCPIPYLISLMTGRAQNPTQGTPRAAFCDEQQSPNSSGFQEMTH